MYVCVYAYIYVYVCMYVCTYVRIYMYVRVYVCVYILCLSIYVCMYLFILRVFVYVLIYTCMYVCMYVFYVYLCTYVLYTYIIKYMLIYIYIHTISSLKCGMYKQISYFVCSIQQQINKCNYMQYLLLFRVNSRTTAKTYKHTTSTYYGYFNICRYFKQTFQCV